MKDDIRALNIFFSGVFFEAMDEENGKASTNSMVVAGSDRFYTARHRVPALARHLKRGPAHV